MKFQRSLLVLGLALGFTAPLAVAQGIAPTPPGTAPSAQDLTRAPAIQSVSISPDGKHLAALTSPDGEAVDVTVWSTDALGAKPVRVRATHMRFVSVRFLKNDRLLVQAEQPLTFEGQPLNIIKQYVTDLEGKSFQPLLPDRTGRGDSDESMDELGEAGLVSTLPRDPHNVLVEDHRVGGEGDIYSVDVYSMSASRVMKGSEKYFDYQVDLTGQLRAREYADFDNGAMFLAQQVRDPDTGAWVEIFRSYAKNRELKQIVGFTSDPHVILIRSNEGSDKAGIFEYDIKQRKIIEPAFQHKLFDATPAIMTSRASADFGRPLGFGYDADTTRVYWLDPHLDALAKSVDKALGVTTTPVSWTDPGAGLTSTVAAENGASVSFVGWSDDFADIVLEKSGPKLPPEYYLLAGGKLVLLGKARPWIDTSTLGDTSLVEYKARDGLLIPAFLTLPPKGKFGPGPYPTLIEPHGGPWARDDMEWDLAGWVQYFASRGYAVLQPQFRGSEGWGDKLWRAGDGQWGLKMQDDNDDAVKWLIDQHIAAPQRVAMFGYSYGGYAALAAAIRPNGLYQCAISGAGAGDLAAIERATFDNRFEREFQHPTIGGLDALSRAREAKIPVLLYHGDHDVTVDPEESRKFAAAVRGAGKPVKLVEIKDMGHQYVFMTPDMMLEQLNIIDAFLKTDCKPGGL
jgi:dipeptidyl aminopeptidase/acylaminoacyl peptidase